LYDKNYMESLINSVVKNESGYVQWNGQSKFFVYKFDTNDVKDRLKYGK
jgi:hypothetical protein